jgi:hypothetical protein
LISLGLTSVKDLRVLSPCRLSLYLLFLYFLFCHSRLLSYLVFLLFALPHLVDFALPSSLHLSACWVLRLRQNTKDDNAAGVQGDKKKKKKKKEKKKKDCTHERKDHPSLYTKVSKFSKPSYSYTSKAARQTGPRELTSMAVAIGAYPGSDEEAPLRGLGLFVSSLFFSFWVWIDLSSAARTHQQPFSAN